MLTLATRALALSPHLDDVELGCGGTVARLVDEGVEVHVMRFSDGQGVYAAGLVERLRQEAEAALAELGVEQHRVEHRTFQLRRFSDTRQGILESFVKCRRRLQPDLVFVPATSDAHQDHQVVCQEAIRAFRGITTLGYELPWNQRQVCTDLFVRLDSMQKKLDALSHFETQREAGRAYMAEEIVLGLARVRGLQCGAEFAEAFEVIRAVV